MEFFGMGQNLEKLVQRPNLAVKAKDEIQRWTSKEVKPGESWRVEPSQVHSIEAVIDSEVLEVSTPHLDDVVRLDDRYGRNSSG